MEHGYQGLDPGSKVRYLLNDTRCDKLFTAVTTVRLHPAKYEKDVDAVVAFLIQYIDKSRPTPSVTIASVTQTRPAKKEMTRAVCGTFKGSIEFRKYTIEKYGSMSMAQ